MTTPRFKNKIAVVTGATRGIGKEIADQLLEEGARVIYTGTQTEAEVNGEYLPLNLSESESIMAFLDQINTLPSLDILVNNAGINKIDKIESVKDEDWGQIIQVNLTGCMALIRGVVPKMKTQTLSHILNMSSIFGVVSKSMRHAYSAAKAGLIGLTRSTALDCGPDNILVNALAPGFTRTDLTQKILGEDGMRELAAQVPLQRVAEPNEIAKTACFLVSPDNTYITGQTLIIDGGFTIK